MASPSTTSPAGVDGQAAVGVAVVGQPEVCAVGHHRLLQRLHVRGSAAVVDVQPVGFGVDRDDGGARGPVGPWRSRRCRAMRAVDDDRQLIQSGGEGLADVAQVPIERVVGVDDPADGRTDRTVAGPGCDQFLDAVLGGVVELVPAGTEDLDPVVGHRVVRRRDHHAELGVISVGQIGHRGSGQHSDPQRVDALAGDACDHRGLQHLAAGPRIAAHHGDAAAGRRGVTEPTRGRRAQRQRQLSGQIAVGDTAHPVGAEQSAHADKFLTDGREEHNRRRHQPCRRRIGTRARRIGKHPIYWLNAR